MSSEKVSQFRLVKSMREGKEAERLFSTALISKGITVQKTPISIDRYDHIDFWIGNNKDGVDVKTMKSRDEIWLELMNTGGNKGWMLGKARYIALYFKDIKQFEMFYRKDLLRYIDDNVLPEVTTNNKEYHKLYTRSHWGKKDMVFKTTYKNIIDLKHYKLVPKFV